MIVKIFELKIVHLNGLQQGSGKSNQLSLYPFNEVMALFQCLILQNENSSHSSTHFVLRQCEQSNDLYKYNGWEKMLTLRKTSSWIVCQKLEKNLSASEKYSKLIKGLFMSLL